MREQTFSNWLCSVEFWLTRSAHRASSFFVSEALAFFCSSHELMRCCSFCSAATARSSISLNLLLCSWNLKRKSAKCYMTRTAHIQLNRFQQCLHKFRRHDSTGSSTETQWELRCFIPSGWRSLIQRISCYLLGKAGVKGEIERGHRSLSTYVRSPPVAVNSQWRFLLQ